MGFGLVWFVARPAWSQTAPSEPLVVEYHAAAACPSEDFFTAQLLARTTRIRLVPAGAPARRAIVTLDLEGSLPLGRLVIQEIDGAESVREVTGDACREVVAALALIAALSVDPNAVTTPVVAPASGPVVASASGPVVASASGPVVAPASGLVVAPASGPVAAAAPPVISPKPPAPPGPFPFRFGVAGGLSAAAGIAPSVLLGGSLSLEMAYRGVRFVPSLRLGLERSRAARLALVGGGVVDFTRTLGTMSLSAVELTAGPLWIAPTIDVEAGALRAVASHVPGATSASRAFAALGLGARVGLVVLGPIALEASAVAAFPLIRDRFFFEPDVTVARPAPVGAQAGIGLVARLP